MPVILFDSGIIIFELSSFEAFKKHSSKVLHGIISASLKIDNAAALSIFKDAEIIPCKTFDECFLKASKDDNSKIIIPESNRITGNIGIEYLIFKYRLNIYSEYFQKIEHNLLGLPGTKISDIKDVYSHGQALSQCSKFIKSNSLIEHVRADTAGSAEPAVSALTCSIRLFDFINLEH